MYNYILYFFSIYIALSISTTPPFDVNYVVSAQPYAS